MTAVSVPWPPRTYIKHTQHQPEGEAPVLTVGTCLARSRTRRRASRRRAAQRAAGNSGSSSSSAGSTTALGTDCVARSIWVYYQTEMSVSRLTKNSTLTSRCPVAAACSSTPHQVTCALGPSSPCGAPLFPAKARAQAQVKVSMAAHFKH